MPEASGNRWSRPARFALAVGLAILLATAVASFVKHAIYPIPAVPVGDPPSGFDEILLPLESGGAELHVWHGGLRRAPAPVVLFFHGNGENLETLKWSGIFERWVELETYAVAVDYPGYGRSGGTPSEQALIAGGLAALDYVREAFPGRPVVVTGWSLGAAVAVQVAAQRPEGVDGVILMSAWSRLHDAGSAHFPAFLVRMLVRERYDSVAAAAGIRCPSLVVHGDRDAIIPTPLGSRLAAALGGSKWVEIEGAGHNDLLAREEVWHEVGSFVRGLAPSS